MDDFRIGSVPSSDPYGKREPYGSMFRKRPRHPHRESGEHPDGEGVLEAAAGEDPAASPGDNIEDSYTPSARDEAE